MKVDIKEFANQAVAIVMAITAVLMLSFSGVARAQSSEEITLDEPDSVLLEDTAEDTSSTEATAGVPDTGFAPSNRVAASAMVFIGGAAIGGAIGLGFLKLKQKQQN